MRPTLATSRPRSTPRHPASSNSGGHQGQCVRQLAVRTAVTQPSHAAAGNAFGRKIQTHIPGKDLAIPEHLFQRIDGP